MIPAGAQRRVCVVVLPCSGRWMVSCARYRPFLRAVLIDFAAKHRGRGTSVAVIGKRLFLTPIEFRE